MIIGSIRWFGNLLHALFLGDLDEYIVQEDALFTHEDKARNFIALFRELLLG